MRRTSPNHAASEQTTGPAARPDLDEVVGVGDAHVVDARPRLRPDHVADRRAEGIRVALARAPPLARGDERPVEDRSRGPLGGREADVPGAHRETVVLPHRGAPDDRRRHAEVLDHPRDDPELLGILLPEVRAVRSHEPEEDGDDRRDADEVPWARRALEAVRHRTGVDGRLHAVG